MPKHRVQLPPFDAAYDYAEGPHTGSEMYGGVVYVFDTGAGNAPVDEDAVVEWLSARIGCAPAFLNRVKHVPLSLDYPYLDVVDEIDVRGHVRVSEVMGPGPDAFHAALAKAMYVPLDRSRPMWDLHVVTGIRGVDGLPDNAVAVLHRIHHTVADGLSNATLARRLFARARPAVDPVAPPVAPSPLVAAVMGLACLPRAFFRYAAAVVRYRNAPPDPLGPDGFDPTGLQPRTRFNQPLLGRVAIARVRIPLAEAKTIGRRLGGVPLNDVLLAAVAGAMRAYLAEVGELPEATITATVPKATRAADEAQGGNGVVLMRVPLCTDVADPVARLRAVRDATVVEKARVEGPKFQASRSLFAAAPALVMSRSIKPMAVESRERLPLSLPTDGASTEVTNVPFGAPDLYFGDAPICDQFAVYQLRDGACLKHFITSLGDRLTITVTVDDVAMPDVSRYAGLLRDSYAELLAAADARGADGTPRAAPGAGADRAAVGPP